MEETLQCKGCGQTTIHIINRIISEGPKHGERDVIGHCQECGEKGRWVSWIISND